EGDIPSNRKIVADQNRRIFKDIVNVCPGHIGSDPLRKVGEPVVELPVHVGKENRLTIVEPFRKGGKQFGGPSVAAAIQSRVVVPNPDNSHNYDGSGNCSTGR